jgi:Fic family protein
MTIWSPRFTLTPSIVRSLMRIEAARALVDLTPLSPAAEAELRSRARVRSAHFSTFIEGNRLTLEEARQVIDDRRVQISGRERDVSEVRNYCSALLRVEEWAKMMLPLTETLICRFHRLAMTGRASRPTPLRKGQNAIRDAFDGLLIYLPPRPEDLPELIAALESWAEEAWSEGLAAPILSGLVHYQIAAIHPFNDGNGRTARLCTSFILHRGGYGLKGFSCLEEQHAQDRQSYYQGLGANSSYDYYEGRAEADLTPWLDYFVSSMADSFEISLLEMAKFVKGRAQEEPEELRRLDFRARRVLGLFAYKETITAPQAAAELGLSERTARNLLKNWVAEGWLVVANPSRRARAYSLSAEYRQYIGSLSAMPQGGEKNEQPLLRR